MIRSTTRLAAVGALVLVAGLGAATTSAQAAVTGAPAYVDSWVALSTGAANTVTWSGDATATQTLTSDQSCAMTSSGAALLSFAAAPPLAGLTSAQSVGLNSGAIGVRDSLNANGTSCSAVDSSEESLTLRLGTTLGTDLVAVSASLDVDLKQNASITAKTYLGSELTGTFRLQSGNTIVEGDATNPNVKQCNMPADSGPDANTGNNCRWSMNAAFDSLTLSADNGSFSLMGGADGVVTGLPTYLAAAAPPGASVLELASRSQIVNCGDTTTQPISGLNVRSSSWKNVDTVGCTPYPYTANVEASAGKSAVHFVKPTWAGGTSEWTTTFSYSSKVPTLEFAFDAAVPTFFQPKACTYDPDGAVKTVPDQDGNYACILSTTVDKKNKTVTFTTFVLGDAWMRG